MPARASPLRLPLFRALWLGSVVSNIGTTMNDTAAVWTMTTLTGSAVMVSLLQAMSSLPLFLLALPAGAIADLVNRRKLILLAQIGALLTATGLAALAWWGHLTAARLLAATFQLGVAAAFTMPAWQAIIPEIVGREQLSPAIALTGLGYNIARALGPVIGGVLVAALGPAPVFAINALSFLAVIGVLFTGGYTPAPRVGQSERMLGAMVAALRYTRHAPAMQAVLWRGGIHIFAAVAPIVVLPILVHGRGLQASDFGLLMGCYGGGAIAAALFLLPALRARFGFDQVLAGASLASAAATAALALAGNRLAMGAVLALAGAGWMSGVNTFSVASQSAFPNWVRARSSAVYLVVMQGSFAIGALAWGRITALWSAPAALYAAAAGLVVSAVLSRFLPISHVEQLDLSPSGHWPEHTLANEPDPDDGPVLVTIEYRIDPAEESEFRAAMSHLRETRLRDGAFRCTVFVDLNDPSLYRETFLVGSWAEHLRQHQRATREDHRIENAVLAFHRGTAPPTVRHLLMVDLRRQSPA